MLRRLQGGGRRRRRGQDGQAIVEFVVALPILVAFTTVLVVGWQLIDASIQLTSAARTGAYQARFQIDNHPRCGFFCANTPHKALGPWYHLVPSSCAPGDTDCDIYAAMTLAISTDAGQTFQYTNPGTACPNPPAAGSIATGTAGKDRCWSWDFRTTQQVTGAQNWNSGNGTQGNCDLQVIRVQKTIAPLLPFVKPITVTGTASVAFVGFQINIQTPLCNGP